MRPNLWLNWRQPDASVLVHDDGTWSVRIGWSARRGAFWLRLSFEGRCQVIEVDLGELLLGFAIRKDHVLDSVKRAAVRHGDLNVKKLYMVEKHRHPGMERKAEEEAASLHWLQRLASEQAADEQETA